MLTIQENLDLHLSLDLHMSLHMPEWKSGMLFAEIMTVNV